METSTRSTDFSRTQRRLGLWQRITDRLTGTQPTDRLWQAARSDHRVWAEYLQASGRDLEADGESVPAWVRFPESLPDGRGNTTHLRHG